MDVIRGLQNREIFQQNLEKFQVIMKQNGLSIFEIGNSVGKVVFRFHRPVDFGDDKSGQKIIQEALSGKISSTLEIGKSGIGLRVTGPILNGFGTILIGQVVNKEFLSEISGMNTIHLALFQEKKLLAASSSTMEEILDQVKTPFISKSLLTYKGNIFYMKAGGFPV